MSVFRFAGSTQNFFAVLDQNLASLARVLHSQMIDSQTRVCAALRIACTSKAQEAAQKLAAEEEARVEEWIELCEKEGKDWAVKLEVKEEEEEARAATSLTDVFHSWQQQQQQQQQQERAEQQEQQAQHEQHVIWTVPLKSGDLSHLDVD